jgi:hypothetical protein
VRGGSSSAPRAEFPSHQQCFQPNTASTMSARKGGGRRGKKPSTGTSGPKRGTGSNPRRAVSLGAKSALSADEVAFNFAAGKLSTTIKVGRGVACMGHHNNCYSMLTWPAFAQPCCCEASSQLSSFVQALARLCSALASVGQPLLSLAALARPSPMWPFLTVNLSWTRTQPAECASSLACRR